MKKSLLFATLGLLGLAFNAGAQTPVNTPYLEDFQAESLPDGWNVTDNNHDGTTWKIWFGKAEISDFFKTLTLDDILTSPPVMLNRLQTYVLKYKASRAVGQNDQAPKLEVRMGLSSDFNQMPTVIMPETEVTDYLSDGTYHVIRPMGTAPHYFAFRATGENTAGISFDDFEIVEASMPEKPQNVTVTMPEQYGDTHVTIAFDAPTLSVGGTRLMGLKKISVFRSGVLVKDYENPKPGEHIVLEDNCPYGSGNYQWKITAYDLQDREGFTAETPAVFIGINTPAAPQNVNVVEKGNTGEVTVSWDLVTEDVRGVPMPAEFIDYQLYANGTWLMETGATSPYTFQAVEPGKQDYLVVLVSAKSAYASGVTASPVMIVGKPYTGFSESFNGGLSDYNFRFEVDPDKPADIYIVDNSLLMMMTGLMTGDADDTNGCMVISSVYTGYNASFGFGKYDLSGIANPTLKFYLYFPEMEDGAAVANVLTVYADQGDGYKEAFTYNMKDHPGLSGWQPVTFDLSKFKDKHTAFKINATVINCPYNLIDGLTVFNQLDNNLIARTPYTDEKVAIGQPLEVQASVENIGTKEAKGASIALLVDGKEVASQALDPILPGKRIMATFRHTLSRVCGRKVQISTRVDFPDDQDLSDNTSEPTEVAYLLPNLPTVTDLTAVADEKHDVTLTWSSPALVVTPERITESFEDGTPNAVNTYGDWTFVDLDDLPTLIITPEDRFPFQGDPVAGAIADAVGHYQPYFPYSGDRFLAMCASEDGPTDDWAISPLLTGEAQTITFWAHDYDTYSIIREPISIMISSTGKEIDNFTQLADPIVLNGTWSQYTVELPEGTKYFAFHYKVSSGLMVMIDDVSFIPADSGDPLEINGYNIYRDGQLITTEAIQDLSGKDLDVAPGQHTYHVTTNFNRGESPASNPADVRVATGITDTTTGNIQISGTNGAIVITASQATDITVTDLSGINVATRTVRGTATIALPAGIYIVTAGDTTAKIAVL